MSLKIFFTNLQKARTKARWPTVVCSFVLFFYSFIFELTLVDYSPMIGSPKEKSILLGVVYRLLFLGTFFIGLFTFPRWYSFLAFASMIWVMLSVMGR
jgi:hypothetical protein